MTSNQTNIAWRNPQSSLWKNEIQNRDIECRFVEMMCTSWKIPNFIPMLSVFQWFRLLPRSCSSQDREFKRLPTKRISVSFVNEKLRQKWEQHPTTVEQNSQTSISREPKIEQSVEYSADNNYFRLIANFHSPASWRLLTSHAKL